MNVREELFDNQDPDYKCFQSNLIPNICEDRIIGVRVPLLRKIAKRLANEKPEFPVYYYEEQMIKGLMIGYRRCPLSEHINDILDFVPVVDNWAVCDSFCSNLKFTAKYTSEMWNVIKSFLDGNEFEKRFSVVMMMDYYISDNYINEILEILVNLKAGDYYCDMAVAWALSVIYLSYPEKVTTLLKTKKLSVFVHNKSIQKMCESYRIKDKEKEYLRSLKVR